MKRNSIFILAIVAVFIAAAGMKPVHQDDPQGKKKNAHVRIITMKDGKEQVVDTVIESGNLKVSHYVKGNDFVWTTVSGEKKADSALRHLEVIKGNRHGKKMIVHRGAGGRGPVIITETETVGDSGKTITVHVEKSDSGEEAVFIGKPERAHRQRLMHAPFAPAMDMPLGVIPMRRHLSDRNVIDLSDPGIISYEKKKLPGGKEKITIIRNEVKETESKVIEIRSGDEVNEEMLREIPHINREIKVKKEVVTPEVIEKK